MTSERRAELYGTALILLDIANLGFAAFAPLAHPVVKVVIGGAFIVSGALRFFVPRHQS